MDLYACGFVLVLFLAGQAAAWFGSRAVYSAQVSSLKSQLAQWQAAFKSLEKAQNERAEGAAEDFARERQIAGAMGAADPDEQYERLRELLPPGPDPAAVAAEPPNYGGDDANG